VRGRIALVSLGCAKNLVDSEGLVATLAASGFALADRIGEADLALVNTCGFIDPARKESVETIVRIARHKEYGRLRGLIVAGCLVERYLEDLRRDLPEVDRWLPFRDYGHIARVAEELMGLPPVRPVPRGRVLLTPSTYAYLKISEGCEQKCAFCAIPSFRGRLRSRTIEENVRDAEAIAASGVAEIDVVSQDTTAYGRDLYGRPRLADLLALLTRIPGVAWWRLLYLYPSTLRDDVLERIAAEERIVKYVDVPLQHMSDALLRRMRRGITAERPRALLERIRERIPEVAIRTTLITGFPGETEADHAENLAHVRDGWFDRLGVFVYSPEEGTPAFSMDGAVPEEVARERRDALMEAQQAVHFAWNRRQVGRRLPVLVEAVDAGAGTATGRSPYDAPDVDGVVHLRPARGATPGRVVPVLVTGTRDYDLEGNVQVDAADAPACEEGGPPPDASPPVGGSRDEAARRPGRA
jgi:ribosomal protein S12 methylthiotransferase